MRPRPVWQASSEEEEEEERGGAGMPCASSSALASPRRPAPGSARLTAPSAGPATGSSPAPWPPNANTRTRSPGATAVM